MKFCSQLHVPKRMLQPGLLQLFDISADRELCHGNAQISLLVLLVPMVSITTSQLKIIH